MIVKYRLAISIESEVESIEEAREEVRNYVTEAQNSGWYVEYYYILERPSTNTEGTDESRDPD